jgi:hypothetical protein
MDQKSRLMERIKNNPDYVRYVANEYHTLADSGAQVNEYGQSFSALEVLYAQLIDRYVDRSGNANG